MNGRAKTKDVALDRALRDLTAIYGDRQADDLIEEELWVGQLLLMQYRQDGMSEADLRQYVDRCRATVMGVDS